MSEVIMVLEEPWYNTLTEQMFEQVIEEIQPEPFIVSSELDNKISYLARISRGHHVDTLLVPREYKDTFKSTELYEILLPNISIGDVQFAKIYYYD